MPIPTHTAATKHPSGVRESLSNHGPGGDRRRRVPISPIHARNCRE